MESETLRALENLRLRLLDLTARNRLINFRHTKKGSLRIIDEFPKQLVETLLTENEMRFRPVPEPTRKELIAAGYIEIDEITGQEVRLLKEPTAEEWADHLGLDTSYEVPEPHTETTDNRHADTAIQTLLYPYELEARLRNLTSTAESAILEMGANILYLAFGFLEWYENDNNHPRIAPLFLVPVHLKRGQLNLKTRTYEYTVSYLGEDIIPNLSLREKLRADFAMALPELDKDTNPEVYFQDVKALIDENQPNWRMCRFITLTLLNFGKLLMYLDLDPSRWPDGASIVDHPIIMRFLAGSGTEREDDDHSDRSLEFGEEYSIDEMDDIHVKYPLIDDADSSQHSALIDAIEGNNLVIQGPPGTGKSQTITNLIAAAMAQGKRVLFVAEKLAALEVVRSRLDAAGLGEFCLELHSHKTQRRKLLEEVQTRLNKHGHYLKPRDLEVEIGRYEELKTTLNEHVKRINQSWKNTGKTLHEIFMAATRYREVMGKNPDSLNPEGYDGGNLDVATQRRIEDMLKTFCQVYQGISGQLDGDLELRQHPWYGVRDIDLQIFDLQRVQSSLEDWQHSLRKLNDERAHLAEGLACGQDEIADTLSGLLILLEDIEHQPSLKGNELLDRLPALRGQALDDAHRYLDFFENIQTLYATLELKVGAEILDDLSEVGNFFTGSEPLILLVNPIITLETLADAVNKLEVIQGQLIELQEPLKAIQGALGEDMAHHLSLTKAGLVELCKFIDLVASLAPSYWRFRDELFDNDELDNLLPKLHDELDLLRTLHDELRVVFHIDDLPDRHELRWVRESLDAGGVFRWFNGSWRSARKRLIGLAAGGRIGFSRLYPLLRKAEEFSRRRQKMNENDHYQEAFGKHLKGLETDLTLLESLRNWYKSVRQEYGVGFGPRVELGTALLDLPREITQSVRSLSEQGMPQQIGNLLDNLESIKKVFTPVPELNSDRTQLAGEDGVIFYLLRSLKEALLACEPLVTDSTISVAKLAGHIELLDSLKQAVDDWNTDDCDDRLFQGRLGLEIGVYADNTSSLSKLRNTLIVADYVALLLNNENIRKRIYAQPEASTFNAITALLAQLKSLIEGQAAKYKDFVGLTKLESNDWMRLSGDQLDRLITRNDVALNNMESLQNWLDYVRICDRLIDKGLVRLVKAVEHGDIDVNQMSNAYKAGVFDILAREILREQSELRDFAGLTQKAYQEQFREYDNRLKELQREKIAWLIDQTDIPEGNRSARASDRTELSLLNHECSKQKRHIPIRQLLYRAGKALVALKPCFMMGPMSVAQYLEPGRIEFDLIIMDEASQIKPQDALGAIARGKQLVVVGDPNQLPPTSFFERVVDDGEADPTTIEESESILDATLPMFASRQLRWHYRSQHESLIAFSNHSFYGGKLILFPSPNKKTDDYGILYSRVPRGSFTNRRNIEEARIISEAVQEHIYHRPEESIGVVAMSAEQRLQIESAIETLTKDDSEFRERLEEDSRKDESLFIKNLENVQGDERDVIFISMTYGPQEPRGKVFQRFGPINSETGWRRLNVLFTRSKKRMHIFSSMGSEDIVVGATARRGVQALRNFLAYCETGILHETKIETDRSPDSDFEIAVIDAMRDKGFECVPQVGVAGFFIDIAVIDPGNRGCFLLGIECDGATYHSAKSARDRDRLRQSILERLGWRILRIWSTDWFKNPHAELQPIIRELNSLKTERVEEPEQLIESEAIEIERIVEQVEQQEAVTEKFISDETGLDEKLIAFDRDIIRRSLPNTPDNQRLLRPVMLDSLLEYEPTSKSEFLEYIPGYLRHSTASAEGQFLEQVLEIINASVG